LLRATTSESAPLEIEATVKGVAVYLDTHSYIQLERNALLRHRFIATTRRGADVLFSLANAIELTGTQGESIDSMKKFLDELGEHWFPLEMNPEIVIKREQDGKTPPESCVAEEFLRRYIMIRRADSPEKKLLDLSGNFFRLSLLLEGWVEPHRNSIRSGIQRRDARMIAFINDCRQMYRRDLKWLDENLPESQFDPSYPATFVYFNLIRQLVLNRGDNLKRGDGIDFCHAVIGAAFSSVMTLDKRWKRRIETLPQPNGVARIYSPDELGLLIEHIEVAVEQLRLGS
jgi:hypothetical protein